ncbi:ectonucleoside triphosphate diphosphohydrolase 1 [Conger conger]|uniref:ectonucleoside triphosphate diphosphohydrolase 1 n=1 Tax=Conger conger TaxID=82655 RepID=UPI002A5A5E47|nr:ectonucleoside triphosphate diphosphohydrolase 1 [Conger conger]
MADQREMKEKSRWRRPLTMFITVLIPLGIIALVTTAVVQNRSHEKYKYGIVLDAGSSHTAVYIYKWPAEKENNTGMVQQKHVCSVKGKGISSYSASVEKAGISLRECMEEAKEQIPAWRHQETPVYLGATAGMRLLRKANETSSDQVLSSVEGFLQKYPFMYQGARIISGQEEGAYGWITVNYLSENFHKARPTMGALDLGGASTQITFVSRQRVEASDNSIHFRLYGNDYDVYTHSFLCYGKDQALKLALANQLQPGDTQLHDPCFHQGYSLNKTWDSVTGSPCVSSLGPLSSSRQSFTLQGTGNATLCQGAVKRIFNFSHCEWGHCSFNGVFQPPVEGKFGAFSAFYYVMNFLNLTSESLEQSKEKMVQYCARPWTEIKESYRHVKEKYLAEYCFSGTYILTLLESGYRFTSDKWSDIKFIEKIGGSDAGWTLGYMLNLTNMIPAEARDTPPLPHAGYVTIMVLFSLLVTGLLLLACKLFGRPVCSHTKPII